MNRIHRLRRCTRLALLGLSATLLAGHAAAAFKVVGYFPTWQGDVNGIPYNKVTHINYSFVLPTATGGLQPLDGGGARLQSLVQQAHGKGVKVLIAVGGWNNGDDSAFRSLAANSGYRAAFVQNLLNLVQQYNLDGVDIDWEYPDGAEVANFKQLMSELSNALRSRGKLLTAAVTANDWPGSFDRTSINYVDFLNLMVYDMGTPHSTYDMARNALAHWKNNEGLPKEKAVLGVPFYSHTGWVTYRDIIARYGTWAADRDDAGGLDYNGRPTIRAKSQLALNEGGGVMFWEISQDTRDTTSLMSTIWDVVGSATIDNPPPTGNVCFFEHTNYQGASACFGEGSFNTSGDWNDRASSVRVAAGYRADLFEHGNYTGRLLTLTGDEPNLVNRNFNDLMTSFRIGRNGGSSVANGRYNLVAVHSGKCVDVAWAATHDGANIQQVGCNGNNAQVFDVVDMGSGWYRLANVNSGKMMDVAANSTADGANIHQWSDNGTGAQRFAIRDAGNGEYTIVNKTSGKCVDVDAWSTADGANVHQWACHGGANQRFRFQRR